MSRRKPYVYRWWDGGRKGEGTYRQETFDTKAEKDDFMAALRERRRLGLPLSFEQVEPDPTLAEFLEDYWRLHAIPNLEKSTRDGYRHLWGKYIEKRLGPMRLQQITPKVINRQLVDAMRREGAGEPTIRRTLAVVQSVLALADAEDRVPSNAAAKVRKPPATVERQVDPIAPSRVELILANLEDQRDRAMVSLLAYRGLRPEELLALFAEDLLHAGERIQRKNVDGELHAYTKTRKDRTVTKGPPQARQDVREYMLATGIRSGLLFPRADGEPWRKHDWDNWRDRTFRPALVAAGWPLDAKRKVKRREKGLWVTETVETTSARPYDLRGSFVSLLAWEGYTMLEVAKQAGHSVQTCEKHYAGVFDDVDPAARTTAEEAVRAAREKLTDITEATGS